MHHKLVYTTSVEHAYQLLVPVPTKIEVMPKLACTRNGQAAATHLPECIHSMASVAAAHVYDMT